MARSELTLVLGLGESGLGAARWLARQGSGAQPVEPPAIIARVERLRAEVARLRARLAEVEAERIDIDHFKSVNDTHGHAVGDTVLRQFAALLRRNVRAVDKVGRLGGEEFLIILPDADSEQARAAARTLQQRLEDFAFDTVQRKTASFGVAQFRDGDDLPSMLERVDRALYKAKADGRNRIEQL